MADLSCFVFRNEEHVDKSFEEAVDYGLDPVYLHRYITQPGDDLPDLGYRWEAGLVDDLDVLAEILQVSRREAQAHIDFGMGSEDFDLFYSRKEDGQIFDWMLEGGEMPYCLRKLVSSH